MEILDTVYFDNSVRVWAVALGTTLVLTLGLSVAKRLIVRRLHVFAQKTATDIDDLIVELLRRTRLYFLAAVGLYAGSTLLHVAPNVHGIIRLSIILILLLQSAVWGNGVIVYLLARMAKTRAMADAASATTMSALGFALRMLLWSVALLLALANLGFDITALVAGLGVGGIAIALALQNILGDLFASLSIVLDKPFVIGDFIVVDTLQGTVEHVGLKTTRVRSISGEQIIFSNTDLLKSRIRNFKRMQERRAVFTVSVTHQTPEEKVAAIPAMIREAISMQQNIRFDRAHFQTIGDHGLIFEAVYVVTSPDYVLYMDIQQNINLALLRRFAAEGIAFAYPTRTLHVRQ